MLWTSACTPDLTTTVVLLFLLLFLLFTVVAAKGPVSTTRFCLKSHQWYPHLWLGNIGLDNTSNLRNRHVPYHTSEVQGQHRCFPSPLPQEGIEHGKAAWLQIPFSSHY